MISDSIKKAINDQIDESSLMIVMLGEKWSKWQEYELINAMQKGVPIVGVLSDKNIEIKSKVFKSGAIAIVNWRWDEISKVLSGQAPSIDYEISEEIDLESPIIQVDFVCFSADQEGN